MYQQASSRSLWSWAAAGGLGIKGSSAIEENETKRYDFIFPLSLLSHRKQLLGSSSGHLLCNDLLNKSKRARGNR